MTHSHVLMYHFQCLECQKVFKMSQHDPSGLRHGTRGITRKPVSNN